jgi:hypothetical protein
MPAHAFAHRDFVENVAGNIPALPTRKRRLRDR